jgi:hypothetical protein
MEQFGTYRYPVSIEKKISNIQLQGKHVQMGRFCRRDLSDAKKRAVNFYKLCYDSYKEEKAT